jgi:AcrR family transcriptional regulator
MVRNLPSARNKLLISALKLIRTKGYGATTVDELCKDTGVTKDAFFHHFKTKEDAAIAATQFWNAAAVKDMIAAAKVRHTPRATWSAESLALHTQAVIQEAFIVAKAPNDIGVAHDSIVHLRRYLELLFHYAKEERVWPKQRQSKFSMYCNRVRLILSTAKSMM